MAEKKGSSWHVLAFGKEPEVAKKAEKHLHETGFKNVRFIGLDNAGYTDEQLIEFIKERQWDAVSIGSGLNGYDDTPPKQEAKLFRFNHLVNLVHEHAPKAKFIFGTGPQHLPDAIERVLGPSTTSS